MELSELCKDIDIVDYISQYVELTENGGEYWGISPFTDPPEKTPSFSVRREDGTFYDFSSGIGGNLFTFVHHYNKCSRREAAEILTKYAGVDEVPAQKPCNLSAMSVLRRFSKQKKPQKTEKTVVLQENCMDRYENRPDKLKIWRDEGISDASMVRFQVRYDAFSNRIVYPIRNPDGKIVNIGGRTLDPEWKAKKQRKYTYFYPWGELKTIYGLAENLESIKKSGSVPTPAGPPTAIMRGS